MACGMNVKVTRTGEDREVVEVYAYGSATAHRERRTTREVVDLLRSLRSCILFLFGAFLPLVVMYVPLEGYTPWALLMGYRSKYISRKWARKCTKDVYDSGAELADVCEVRERGCWVGKGLDRAFRCMCTGESRWTPEVSLAWNHDRCSDINAIGARN